MTTKEERIYECVCGRCENVWRTRTFELPKVCPNCNSRNWDDPPDKPLRKVRKSEEQVPHSTKPVAQHYEATQERSTHTPKGRLIWYDPVNKQNPCHYCMVPDGEPHRFGCEQVTQKPA